MVNIFKTQMTQDEKIYVSFASLDPSDEAQIMKWIEFFGIPVKDYPEDIDKLENQWQQKFAGGVSMQRVKDEIVLMKWILNMHNLFMSTNTWVESRIDANIIDILNRYHISKPKDDSTWNMPGLKYFNLTTVIARIINMQLSKIHPFFAYEDSFEVAQRINMIFKPNKDIGFSQDYSGFIKIPKDATNEKFYDEKLYNEVFATPPAMQYAVPKFYWSLPSLLSAMYFQMMMDITKSLLPLVCTNPKCKKFFSPKRINSKYCSDTCRNRHGKQKLYKPHPRQKKDMA
jgi:hypothetical protein